MKAQTLRENRVREKEKRKTTTTTTKNQKKTQTNKKKGKKNGERKEEEEVEKKKCLAASHPSVKGQRPQEHWIGAHVVGLILAGKITAFPSAFRRPLSQHSCILINGNVCSHIHVLTICAAKIGF